MSCKAIREKVTVSQNREKLKLHGTKTPRRQGDELADWPLSMVRCYISGWPKPLRLGS